MNPDSVRHLLAQYVDRELSPAETAQVEQALTQSDALRAEAERWRRLRLCVNRVVTTEPVPADVRSRLEQSLLAQRSRDRQSRGWRLGVALLASAAAIGLALTLRFQSARDVPDGSGGPLLASAFPVSADRFVAVYEHCAKQNNHTQLALEGPCPIAAQKKISGTEKFKAVVPDLRAQGFELQGICHCLSPNLNAVHAHFREKGASGAALSVFSVDRCLQLEGCCRNPRGCGGTRIYELAESKGVRVLKWNDASGSFALCGEFEEGRLQQLAESVRIALDTAKAPPFASLLP